MLIYANCVKTTQPISFFFHQKMRIWYLDNYKKEGEILYMFQETQKMKSWVQLDPPTLMHFKSVNRCG